MNLCARCHRREAPDGYKTCAECRADNNRAQRAYYAKTFVYSPDPTRKRAIKLLSMFVMSPRELSCALDIPVPHAKVVLHRLWRDGTCERWPYSDRSYRYRLRDAA